MSLPTFDSLPIQRPGPPLNAWGLYGPEDELGRLNLITPEVVQRGLKEVKHGIVINLNLPLTTAPLHPSRKPLEHNIEHRGHCNDDSMTLNTQTSTQWDGFRHYPYQDYPAKGEYAYYGGMSTKDAIDKTIHRNGIQNYADHPITSRAHLLDVADFLENQGKPPLRAFETDGISLQTLQAAAGAQSITFLPGDILLVRTGWTEAFFALSEDERKTLKDQKRMSCGVSADEEVLRWHWDNGIAAVATDTVAYECYPSPNSPSIHEVFLAGWGLPIGELFDLRELAKQCKRLNQYTFFFSSMPLNVPGGIASPPNAQAIL